MHYWLCAHADHPPPPGLQLRVDVGRRTDRFANLHFTVYGAIDRLVWHDAKTAGRYDELWRHGCFEAFIRCAQRDRYLELNFAPEKRWAAYAFDSRREGIRDAEVFISVQNWVARKLSVSRLEMQTLIEVPDFLAGCDWAINLATVLEATDGTKSYWALAHGDGPPDFHNPDCFIATLPAPRST